MNSLLRRLDPLDILAKPKVMEYIGPIFAGLSPAALNNAMKVGGDVFHQIWMSLSKEERKQLKDGAKPYRNLANVITPERILRWLGQDYAEHAALIQAHPNGLPWLSKCVADLKVDLLT